MEKDKTEISMQRHRRRKEGGRESPLSHMRVVTAVSVLLVCGTGPALQEAFARTEGTDSSTHGALKGQKGAQGEQIGREVAHHFLGRTQLKESMATISGLVRWALQLGLQAPKALLWGTGCWLVPSITASFPRAAPFPIP